MSDIKISGLDDASGLDGSELLEVVQGGVNKKVTVEGINSAPLAGDRAIELGGHELALMNNGFPYFKATPNDNVTGIASTNGTSVTNIEAHSGNESNACYFILESNNGVNDVQIYGDGGENELEYTAATHTFTGNVVAPNLGALDFADDAAAESGGVVVGQWYHTSGTLKIRIS